MTCVTLALLGTVDEKLKKRLQDTRALQDHYLGKAGADYLLATSERRLPFEGVTPLQMDAPERASEDYIALISQSPADFSLPAYRIYADPFNTPGLVDDNRIGDGFILRAAGVYDSPEDNLRLLRALKAGAKISAAFRRGGEPSAAMDDRLLLARSGPYHPSEEDILRPFSAKAGKAVKLHVLSFNVKGGKITIDNTFRPKTAKLAVF